MCAIWLSMWCTQVASCLRAQVGKQPLHLHRLSRYPRRSRCDCVFRSFTCESLLTVDVLLLPKAKAKTHLPAVPGRSPRGPGTLASHHDIMHSKTLTRDVIHGDILPTQQSWNPWHTQLLRLLLLYFQAALPRELDSWTLRNTASFSERLKHPPAGCMYGPWLW